MSRETDGWGALSWGAKLGPSIALEVSGMILGPRKLQSQQGLSLLPELRLEPWSRAGEVTPGPEETLWDPRSSGVHWAFPLCCCLDLYKSRGPSVLAFVPAARQGT